MDTVVKTTKNTNFLVQLSGLQPLTESQQSWLEKTVKENRLTVEKLETELKVAKTNLIKETIRIVLKKLGDQYFLMGDYLNALKNYQRLKDFNTTSKHVIDMCFDSIKTAIETKNFSQISSLVVKIESTPEIPSKQLVLAKANALKGLVHLNLSSYKQAARHFLDVNFCLGSEYNDVISPNDIAILGGLTALSTFDRKELKQKVFKNQNFKQFLELEPDIKEILYLFQDSKYCESLDILERKKNDYYLDIFLAEHFDALLSNIRKKAICQYFEPFSSVDLRKMAKSFNVDNVKTLENEIAQLIMDNLINARIDSHNKVLRIKETNLRTATFEKSIKFSEEYKSNSKFLIFFLNLQSKDLIVKDERSPHIHYGGMSLSSNYGGNFSMGEARNYFGGNSNITMMDTTD
ncbi:cop9 signalosome complex subunit [Clydaea vesicula]|uniref:Cop9 signalosome complex subunit n=1 Tax=Clydaea vesicula TaxID=447962 RepID=A0AAD5U296_9FUNG|nr:cop9 signalosome complex subunit [Clydaea vesicula]